MKLATITLLAVLTVFLAGCDEINYQLREMTSRDDYSQYDSDKERYLRSKSKEPEVHLSSIASTFNTYNLIMPNGNRIRVCSAHSCTYKQIYRLQAETLRKAKGYLDSAWTARGERNALERGLAYIEQVMGPATGTQNDAAGGAWGSNGREGQLNHIDEALNTTSILMVMYRYKMLRYHDLLAPQYRGGTMYAVIRDRSTGELFGIDTGYRGSGGEVKIFPWRGAAP